jgi:YD repeat-containing protein
MAGRLLGVPGEITSTAYNAAGQVTAIAYQNGVTTSNTYNDARAFLMAIATKDAALANINSVTYTRDAAGRILTAVSSPTAENWTYTYDKLDRLLTSVNTSDTGANRSFTYDAAGNILTNSGIGTYTYPAQGPTAVRPHAQTAAGASNFTYDANGNMLTGSERTLVYDGENRIVSAANAGGTTTYAYGPDGARLTTVFTPVSGPAVTTYLLGQEIEIGATGTLTKLPHPDLRRIGTSDYFVHRDHLSILCRII